MKAFWIVSAAAIALSLAIVTAQQTAIGYLTDRVEGEHRRANDWQERALVAERELELEKQLSEKKDAEIEHWQNECAVRVLPPDEAQRRFGGR